MQVCFAPAYFYIILLLFYDLTYDSGSYYSSALADMMGKSSMTLSEDYKQKKEKERKLALELKSSGSSLYNSSEH